MSTNTATAYTEARGSSFARKRVLAFTLMSIAVALIFGLSGCATSEADYSGQTITGKVESISGDMVTLALGELKQENAGAPPSMPGNGDSAQSAPPAAPNSQNGGSAEPPAMPDGEEPPAKPEGASDASGEGNEPPAMPNESAAGTSGENTAPSAANNQGEPPAMPEGEQFGQAAFEANGQTAQFDISEADFGDRSASDIKIGDILELTVGSNNKVQAVSFVGAGNGGFGGSGTVNQGASATTISEDETISGQTYTSSGDDENALRVTDGATVSLSGIIINKSGGASSNTEDGDFYGMNAALLATDGANVTISDSTVKSDAQNGNGIFSYGEGTVVNVSNTTIRTQADNSGGIQTTGGATTNAQNLDIKTQGASAAAIRSDRGGGTVNVDGGTYVTNGYNSPAIYSTAAISVSNATLAANNSEALVIEGKNSIALENCEVSGNMSSTGGTSSDENVHNVMIYQSMSGDADVGTSEFSMRGGNLVSNNGDVFYVTNTHSKMTLSNVAIANNGGGALLRVVGNSAKRGWGTAGKNGGQLELSATNQTLEGDIVVDTISTLSFVLTDSSSLVGTINVVENEQGGQSVDGNAVVTIEEGCTWTLTGNCTISSLENKGQINFNGYSITLADGTVLQ